MKKIILINFLVFLLVGVAFGASNQEIVSKYQAATNALETKKYKTAVTLCNEIDSLVGQKTIKVQIIKIKALYGRKYYSTAKKELSDYLALKPKETTVSYGEMSSLVKIIDKKIAERAAAEKRAREERIAALRAKDDGAFNRAMAAAGDTQRKTMLLNYIRDFAKGRHLKKAHKEIVRIDQAVEQRKRDIVAADKKSFYAAVEEQNLYKKICLLDDYIKSTPKGKYYAEAKRLSSQAKKVREGKFESAFYKFKKMVESKAFNFNQSYMFGKNTKDSHRTEEKVNHSVSMKGVGVVQCVSNHVISYPRQLITYSNIFEFDFKKGEYPYTMSIEITETYKSLGEPKQVVVKFEPEGDAIIQSRATSSVGSHKSISHPTEIIFRINPEYDGAYLDAIVEVFNQMAQPFTDNETPMWVMRYP